MIWEKPKPGEIKMKGAYVSDLRKNVGQGWHQDHSALVVQKAVGEFVRAGVPVSDYIAACDDPYDFCLIVKIGRNMQLVGSDGYQLERIQRYHIALRGIYLTKIMPPKEPGGDLRRVSINKGFVVQPCNQIADFVWSNLNRHWYIHQALKLVEGLGLDPEGDPTL